MLQHIFINVNYEIIGLISSDIRNLKAETNNQSEKSLIELKKLSFFHNFNATKSTIY